MAPFSIPAPCIIPLRLPVFGGPKSIDSDTKVQLLCETQYEHEIFYTLDGTKPQPYAGIVQGNKTIKYTSPFCLPIGKITIRAIALNPNIHTMCSSVITKCYEVVKGSTENIIHCAKSKQSKKEKKKHSTVLSNEKIQCNDKEVYDSVDQRFNSFTANNSNGTNCFEEAFIGGSDFETVISDAEGSVEDQNDFPSVAFEDDIDVNSNEEVSEDSKLLDNMDKTDEIRSDENDSDLETERIALHNEKDMIEPNFTATSKSAASNETQFCCVKCDLTLQHCSSCNRMNAVSSKYCIECGKQLAQICVFCKEQNPSIATFCQYCGKKLGSTHNTQLESSLKVDHSMMAIAQFKNVSIQKSPVLIDRYTQTINEKSPVKKCSQKFQMRHLPHHSPGRGYWHQQLDYICNHLKSHAYNHVEFRKEISEPMLCDFKSAQISKDENNITVAIVFSPLLTDKNNHSASEEVK